MGNISSAVTQSAISRTVGYELTIGQQLLSSPNLPVRIAILGPANNANQTGLGANPQATSVTSAQQAADLYGAGSPIHQIMRILRPIQGGGVGPIPTVVYPQVEASGATGTTIDVDVTGTANKNISHRLIINGRDNVDGEIYEFTVLTTDNAAAIRQKIIDTVNAVVNAPVTASEVTNKAQLATKWRGSTSAELTVSIDTRGDSAGLTYTVDNKVNGTGTESITNALNQFGTNWNNIVINPYVADKFVELETFNGTPFVTPATGRYEGIEFRPFVALYGSTESDRTTIETETGAAARRTQPTNVLCPAPNSAGYTWEAAANVALIVANIAQNTPHLAYGGQSYSDMPVPADGIIGDMESYVNRDSLAKNGSSTVQLVDGKYQIQELVTTFRPTGSVNPAYRYVRDLFVHWNIAFGYKLREARVVRDKTIAPDDATVVVNDVVKFKEWRAEIFEYADDLAQRALISSADNMKESIVIGFGTSNPNRIETAFSYNTTGVARISSTTAEANFTFN